MCQLLSGTGDSAAGDSYFTVGLFSVADALVDAPMALVVEQLPFRYDITDIAHFGGKNVIAVKVDASKFEGWFYEGAGIYRHVWLDKTAPVAIAPDGVFVYTHLIDDSPNGKAKIFVSTKLLDLIPVLGSPGNQVIVQVKHAVISPNGKTNFFVANLDSFDRTIMVELSLIHI